MANLESFLIIIIITISLSFFGVFCFYAAPLLLSQSWTGIFGILFGKLSTTNIIYAGLVFFFPGNNLWLWAEAISYLINANGLQIRIGLLFEKKKMFSISEFELKLTVAKFFCRKSSTRTMQGETGMWGHSRTTTPRM